MTIFKSIVPAVLTIILPATTTAQEVTDTIAVHELNEVVVKAPKVIRKEDMDVYYHSQSAVEN